MGGGQGRRDVQVELRLAPARRRLARAALRRVRRLHRRLGHRGRALHASPRASSSCGSARACWAAAPTTGAASRCASARGTSRRAAATASATTGRSATTTSSPTTTSSTASSASSARTRASRTSPTASSSRRPRRARYERLIKKACDQLEITCIPSRLSILTQPLNGRPACHYCGQCGRGCATHSNFSTPSVLLPPALATGKLHDRHGRDGARGADGRRRAGHRRLVRRHRDRPRGAGPREDRGAGGQRLRERAAAAELEVVAPSERPRQLQRRGRAAT